MDVWIRWLGEVFWRITKLAPSAEHLKSDPKNEEFWFRAYGVVMLITGLWAGLHFDLLRLGFITGLVTEAGNYPGADKSFVQPYVSAVVVLIVGIATAIIFVAVATLCISLSIRFVGWCLLQWSKRYQERHPEATRKQLAVWLGLAAGLIVAALILAAPNLKFTPPDEKGPAEPPVDKTHPAA